MEHRKIANLLRLAGGVALLGLLYAFFIWRGPAGSESSAAPAWLPTLYKSLAALPYLAALFFYFRICKSIARSRSFSRENVRSLGCIARLLLAAVALWALGLLLLAFGVAPILTQPAPLACTLLVLAAAATIAVSLVAWSLERLLAHAVRLQEENELTI